MYGNIQKAVEVNSSNKNITIMIDDISLLEVATNGSTKDVLNFMHYSHTLTTQFVRHYMILFFFSINLQSKTYNHVDINVPIYFIFSQGCTIVIVLHDDIYSSGDGFTFPLQLEYLADITIKTEPLITGLAADVHGQVFAVFFLDFTSSKLILAVQITSKIG